MMTIEDKTRRLKHDVVAVCGALTPSIMQLMNIQAAHLALVNEQLLIATVLKMLALVWIAIIYCRFVNPETDIAKTFFHGMAAPSIMIAVVEPLLKSVNV